MRDSITEKLKPTAAEILASSNNRLNVGDLSRKLDTSWSSARQILMLLWVEGVVSCEKTSNGLLCKTVDKDASED